MPIGSAAGDGQEVSLTVNDNVPFEAVYLVFSRETAVSLAPFFDLTTDPSR